MSNINNLIFKKYLTKKNGGFIIFTCKGAELKHSVSFFVTICQEDDIMYISFEELFHIHQLKDAKLVAGVDGTWRHILGAHVIEMANVSNYIKEGELLFISGVALKNKETELKKIVESSASKNIAGIFVETGPFIKKIPECVIELANKFKMPLIEIPFEVPVGEIISKIYYLLYNNDSREKNLEELLESVLYENSNVSYDKLLFYGFSENENHVVLVIGLDNTTQIMDNNLSHTFLGVVKEEFSYVRPFLYLREENHIIAIISYRDSLHENELKEQIEGHVKSMCEKLLPIGKTVSAGVGKNFHSINHIFKSVQEAKKTYQILRACQVVAGVRYYEDIGVYQLFFQHDRKELEVFANEGIGMLEKYDKANDSELYETLKIYLEESCNMSMVTERMFIHRNTVKYRIKRIEEILGYDISNVNRQFNLRLAYKIRKYLDSRNFN